VQLSNLQGEVEGEHWESLRALLPAFRSISHSRVADGRNTSFWNDLWLPTDQPMSVVFPAPYSHFRRGDMSVKEVLEQGIRSLLQPRLSPRAASELEELHLMLQVVQLTDGADERVCAFEKKDHKLATTMIYRASVRGDQKSPSFNFVWRNHAPPRVRFFAWLLVQNRIQCKVNLAKKNIVDDATCELCKEHDEDADHIVSGCRFARQFWTRIGWAPEDIYPVDRLWETKTPPGTPEKVAPTWILLCCWELWKHRHDVVFRKLPPNIDRLVVACKESAGLWQCRFPRNAPLLSAFWRSISWM
jgi:hypothetical protein